MPHALRCAKPVWIQHPNTRTEDTATIPAPAHPGILAMLKDPNINVEYKTFLAQQAKSKAAGA